MKIAYLAEWDAYKSSGVLSKIHAQTTQWRAQGEDVITILVSPADKSCSPIYEDFIIQTNTWAQKWPFYGRHFINRVLCVSSVDRILKDYDPDIIYYRQGIWYPGLDGLLSDYRVILELNTLDIKEIEHFNLLFKSVYKFGRKKIIDAIDAFVSVSNEITDYYLQYGKPVYTIANGCSFDDAEQTILPSNGSDPELIMVGTPGQRWHGVDKLEVVAKSFPDWLIHLVGPELKSLPSNVIQHGFLTQEELSKLYKKVNIGIGSLALHRNGMNEASPLKTREYGRMGLPMIVGYEDSDLDGQEFVLNIGNHETNVEDNLSAIQMFVDKWKTRRVDLDQIRPLLDIKVKESKRVAFFKSLI